MHAPLYLTSLNGRITRRKWEYNIKLNIKAVGVDWINIGLYWDMDQRLVCEKGD
jgi:hypothetical protein